MPDNVVNAVKAREAAMERHFASFDARRTDLLAKMAAINDQLVALQDEQNKAADDLNREHDAAHDKARASDLAEEAAEREARERGTGAANSNGSASATGVTNSAGAAQKK